MFSTLDQISDGIKELRKQLSGLHGIFGGSAKASANAARRSAKSTARKTARKAQRKVSTKVRNLRKLQGRYMGLVRNLSAAQKARVKTVKQEKGYGAALRLAASIRK
jgi:hypothetical protein